MKKHKKTNPSMTDDENPEWTAADFRRARPAREVVPHIVKAYEFRNIARAWTAKIFAKKRDQSAT